MSADGELTAAWLADHVDISCVQAQHTRWDVDALAATARAHHFVSAHVLPNRLPQLRELLQGSKVAAGAPVGFPTGGATSSIKLAEARELLSDGVQELDIVINIGRLRSGEIEYCVTEVESITKLVAGWIPSRLVLEVSRLTPDEIRRGCDVALAAAADYVKTGTGWAGPTALDDVRLIAEHLRGRIALKAAGGIRTLDDVRAMRELGVSRFGINDEVAVRLLQEIDGVTP